MHGHLLLTAVRLLAPVALLATLLVTTAMAPPPVAAEGNEAPGNPAAFRTLAAGGSHVCAILANGSVRCWGRNTFGALGLGDTTSRGDEPREMGAYLPAVALGTGRTATAITAGTSHTCALLDNATVKCWGRNTEGQLGLGDTLHRGDGAGEMGNNLPAVSLGTNRTATALTAGSNHTCAVLDNGTLKCWGDNAEGRLGLGDTADRGDAAGEMGNSLPAVSLGTGRTATGVSAGLSHTCALLDNARVKCWGNAATGRLGLYATNRGDAPGEMGDSLLSVSLGTGRTVVAVTAGDVHTCTMLDNGTRKCWGSGADGRLGQEDTRIRGTDSAQMGNNLPAVFLPPAGIISGTITDAVNATPLGDAVVVALRTADFSLASSSLAGPSGDFTMSTPAGDYFLYLLDRSASHADGFLGAPTVVTVGDGATVDVDPTMDPFEGGFSGVIREVGTDVGLDGVAVFAIGPAGIAGGTTTSAGGGYTLSGLPVGTYRAVIVDGVGRRAVVYWPNSPDFAGASVINVTAGATTPNVNAALSRP